MNNFFSSSADYNLFKKALRSTNNEPVVINIMSDDSSLDRPDVEEKKANVERKNMSSKYQASPFGKFFGPRKQRTDPIDMKDFSSWKNKNYRQSEKQAEESTEDKGAFSFSDYLKSRTRDTMYNDEDKVKADLQKPIDKMSIYDKDYNRFSLDSYLNKLERQSKVDKDFKETEDLMDPFENAQEVVPTSDQDENFSYATDVDVEKLAFEDFTRGESFAFEREELDKVRTRLDKIEREANNIKDKPTEKVISTNELSDIAKESEDDEDEDDSFNLDKLGFNADDIETINAKLAEKAKEDEEKEAKRQAAMEARANEEMAGGAPFVGQGGGQNLGRQVEFNEPVSAGAGASSGAGDLKKYFVDVQQNEPRQSYGGAVLPDSSGNIDVSEVIRVPQDTSGNISVVISGGEQKTIDTSPSKPAQPVEPAKETAQVATAEEDNELKQDISGEALTKAEFKSFTEEIISKFSDMYKAPEAQAETETETEPEEKVETLVEPEGDDLLDPIGMGDPNEIPGYNIQQPYDQFGTPQPVGYGSDFPQQMGHGNILQQQTELQAKMLELIEQNKRSDSEVAEKLRLAEIEKQKVAEEYENRLKELEKTIRQREEDAKQKAYIEKLKSDIKLKKAETDYKIREARIKESEKHNSKIQFVGAQLKAELKNSINVSNLEMEKMLLECVTKLNREAQKEREKQEEIAQAKIEAETEVEDVEEVEEEVVDEPKTTKTTRARGTRGRSTTRRTTTRRTSTRSHSHTRTPRRKIDSDIIGGINFD